MKRTANLATIPSRINMIKTMLSSIENQFDEIRIYANGFKEVPDFMKKYTVVIDKDLTDNGKFYFLSKIKEPEYYFSMDDDIIYPPTYAQDMINAIDNHKCIVTHHGRLLKTNGVSYYRGHNFHHCTNNNFIERYIDVAGTGVTAFNTSYFNPNKIYKSKDLLMSDIIFSLEASNQKKLIRVLEHNAGYIRCVNPTDTNTIHARCSRSETRQIELADEIYFNKLLL